MRLSRATGALLAAAALVVAGCADDGGTSTTTRVTATSTSGAPPTAPPALGEDPQPVVIGHRGAAGHHPDNSLEGFAAARDLGASWVELDVRLSSDDEVVLSHDPETAAGSVVAETPAPVLAAEGVATFAEALEVIEEHGLGVDVELKALPWEEGYDAGLPLVDATVAVLEEQAPAGPVVLSSFNTAAIDRVRELAGDTYDTALITSGLGDAGPLARSLATAGHDGLAVGDNAVTAASIAAFTEAGVTVWAWTIDDATLATDLVDRGVAGIITDVPDVISEALAA
jgi:glycerophosphoryl diester phosphodiesterase